ncbi:MAG: UpxY family transcription antiterminator [Candidatus Acidiferrales bacterium]
MSLNEAPWYAIYTKHQHEKSAAKSLSNRGIETFVPVYRGVHRWKDRNKNLLLPLFPCYVFVRTDLERKTDILRTPGVHWLVGNGGYASEIPPQELEALRAAANGPAHLEPYPFLQTGDRVRVRSGLLAGVEGILIRLRNQYRLVLSVQLLKQSAAVEVDLGSVERIFSESAAERTLAPALPKRQRSFGKEK